VSRAPILLQPIWPYHVVAKSNNGDWFNIPMSATWGIFSEFVDEVRSKYGFQTHAFELMANHYHWILSTPNSNLSDGMQFFGTRTSTSIAREANRINRIYGSRYKPTIIDSPNYYFNVIRYVYQNPLRAGVCDDVRKYPWSTFCNQSIKVEHAPGFDIHIPKATVEYIDWLNTIPDGFTSAVHAGLRRSKFKFPRVQENGKKMTGLEFIYDPAHSKK
jgi:REP element-mobilizing transposase RayT